MLIDMARITELECVGLDVEPEIIEVARENVSEAGFKERIRFVTGDVHNMPLPDNFADLIMSRGSIPFWRDRVRAFKEIYRVLKPGGVAFIGGGGSRYLTDEYYEKRKVPWSCTSRRDKLGIPHFGNLDEIVTKADIPKFKIIKQGGRWAEIRK
jgi:Methylase involved in ubiquinone/menaquinone biosynthesis